MKIGINGTGLVQRADAAPIVAQAIEAERQGFASYWLAEHPTGGFDALTVLAAVGAATETIELGTAVVPTFPRHPAALAGQAITVNHLVGGRLTLGIGLSHAPMMAELGIEFDKPIRHLREFLSVLMPLLTEGAVDYEGEVYASKFRHFKKPEPPLDVVVAALGPQALGVTGRLAHGTVLAWVGEKTIREHIAPRIRDAHEAAQKAGAPRIVATLPVCVTDQADQIRARIAKGLSMYGQLPSYRAMFEREGVAGPEDLAIVGGQAEVLDYVGRLKDAGVTEFIPTEFVTNGDEAAATREVLVSLL